MALLPTSSHAVAVTAREQFYGGGGTENVVIADSASAPLVWIHGQNDTLVDLSTSTAPTIITAGVYDLAVTVHSNLLTVGGWYGVSLDLDASGDDAVVRVSSPIAATATRAYLNYVSVTGSWYCAAGAVLSVTVTNNDGASARTFSIALANLQRVS